MAARPRRPRRGPPEHLISFEYRDPVNPVAKSVASVAKDKLPPNSWSFIAVSWKTGGPMKIFVRDAEVTYDTPGTMPATLHIVEPERIIHFGLGTQGKDSAKGWLDEIVIRDAAW